MAAELLPQPNHLPTTFPQLKYWLKDETIPVRKLHVCINDCMVFKDATEEACMKCQEDRYTVDSMQRKVSRKVFSYCSLSDSLEALFNCTNIAQIMQAVGGNSTRQLIIKDIKDTSIWSSWVDEDENKDAVKIILGFNTDGVNPYHTSGINFSFWPLIFTIFNLPSYIRTKADALMLYAVVPSKVDRRGCGVEPDLQVYQELMINELLQLSSTELYSAYVSAPVIVKVKLLLYMMDFQGYSKYFRMSGSNAYHPCNLCLIKSTKTNDKMQLLGHDGYTSIPKREYHAEVNLNLYKFLFSLSNN